MSPCGGYGPNPNDFPFKNASGVERPKDSSSSSEQQPLTSPSSSEQQPLTSPSSNPLTSAAASERQPDCNNPPTAGQNQLQIAPQDLQTTVAQRNQGLTGHQDQALTGRQDQAPTGRQDQALTGRQIQLQAAPRVPFHRGEDVAGRTEVDRVENIWSAATGPSLYAPQHPFRIYRENSSEPEKGCLFEKLCVVEMYFKMRKCISCNPVFRIP
jgi:hypothetical protein